MAKLVPYLDTEQPAGQKLSPEMRAEIAEVAPSGLTNGSVKTSKLDDKAVTTPKLADGAATSPKIAAKGVKTVNIDDQAVGSPQLADNAVTAAKAGLGVVTAFDKDGNPIDVKTVYMKQSEYAAITPVPGVEYHLTAG